MAEAPLPADATSAVSEPQPKWLTPREKYEALGATPEQLATFDALPPEDQESMLLTTVTDLIITSSPQTAPPQGLLAALVSEMGLNPKQVLSADATTQWGVLTAAINHAPLHPGE